MVKRKGLIASLSILLICISSFLVFLFSRPLVVFFTGDVDSSYIARLDKPKRLTSSYRTKTVGNVDENVLNKADLIINHSVIGLDNENVYDMPYDLEALVGPYADRIGDDAVYLYDSTDSKEVELLSFLKARIPGIEGVPYESEIGRSDYGVYGNRVGDGLIISTSLDETIGFIRSLESPRIAVTYLDAAALETIKPVLVFLPDWDEIIRGNL